MADWTQGLPYDGWYNGHVETMIKKGTYADFREKIAERVQFGFYGKDGDKILAKWDKEWEEIPLEERIRRRDEVVEYTTPKEVVLQTSKGTIVVKKSGPSGDDNPEILENKMKKRESKRVSRPRTKAKGALNRDNDPLRKRSTTSPSK